MSAADILVIILSTALAVLLVLSIILVVMLIRIARQIQAVTRSAEHILHGVERLTANLGSLVAPATLLGLAKKIIQKVKERQGEHHGK